jgi:amino acid transporter
VIAAPVIAVMFILGTSSVLAFVPVDRINLIGPIPQVFSIGFGASAVGSIMAGVAILLLTGRSVANFSIVFTATSRMPMVAGWNSLLPAWFTTLHPKYRTPVNSILFVGLVALVFGAAGIAGVGEQEAFQLLDNAAGIFYGLTYLVLFAIPVVAFRGTDARLPLWLRVASVSGFAVTLLYVVLSIFPIIDVTSWLSFALKISAVVIGLNVVGAALFFAERRRRESAIARSAGGLVDWRSRRRFRRSEARRRAGANRRRAAIRSWPAPPAWSIRCRPWFSSSRRRFGAIG